MGTAASTSQEEIIAPDNAKLLQSQPQINAGPAGGIAANLVKISKDGFIPSEVNIAAGEVLIFEWDEALSGSGSVTQVVNDGESLKPVTGGYSGAKGANGRFRQMFNLEGQYKFAVTQIRCTPLTVTVKQRQDHLIEVTDEGFSPQLLRIGRDEAVQWSWKLCDVPHTVKELQYLMEKGSFRNVEQKGVATVSGSYRKEFNKPGLYYFKTETATVGQAQLGIIHVLDCSVEHKIEITDDHFEPMILAIQEGDRVWWEWKKDKCKKQHYIYQVDPPSLGQPDDAIFEATPEGFQWPYPPSKQGLMTHRFTRPGVYYFSDRNRDAAAVYMGSIIVKPKAKEHKVKVTDTGFEPEILRINTGDLIWLSWNVDPDGERILQIEEEERVQCLPIQRSEIEEKQIESVKESDLRLMTTAGLAFINLNTIGVYTYKLSERSKILGTFSVIVNPGPKSHTIYVTENGFEPSVLTIRPNDRVYWLWQKESVIHNIKQVSHQGTIIKDGFCSGALRESPSVFLHQFFSQGVFYFISDKVENCYGSIVVSSQPHVHEVEVSKKEFDKVHVKVNDIVCWIFSSVVNNNVVPVGQMNKAVSEEIKSTTLANKRRCIARTIDKIGVNTFCCLSFNNWKNKVCVVVCDERSDHTTIKVSRRGFHPKKVYLQKGQTVTWTWKGTDEEHNIIEFNTTNKDNQHTFSSGELVLNNCFLFTFDDPGEYTVVSKGAPGFYCEVNIEDEIARSAAPAILPGSMHLEDGNMLVKLEDKTGGADIYYTTDGTLPALHIDGVKHYKPNEGIVLRKSGIIRAIAVKSGQVQSYPMTSEPIWVDVKEGMETAQNSDDEAGDTDDLRPKDPELWDWWGCRPYIRGCITEPGVIEVFWKLPEKETAKQMLKGYNIFLNGVSYCGMFPPNNNTLNISGLAGGRTYKIHVEAYPKNLQNVFHQSNNLYLKCPIENDEEGPVISLVLTDRKDSLAIVWMSIDKPDVPIDSYLVFLNDQQCGPKLVPEPKSNRCKVVIEKCDLNRAYKIHVTAILANSKEIRMSNILEVSLPLDKSSFKYPPEKDRMEGEDLYSEFIEVAEGSGYLSDMDNPENPIWETETDSTSGQEDTDTRISKMAKKRHLEGPVSHDELVKKSNTNDFNISPAPVIIQQQESLDSESDTVRTNQTIGLNDGSVVLWDASKNIETSPAMMEHVTPLKSDPLLTSNFRGMGLAIIEVQKVSTLDKSSPKEHLALPTPMNMIRVNEGELVPGDINGHLPSPSIMAKSVDRQSMVIGWKLPQEVDPQYELQLFVVNVVGTRFSSSINSDISFEYNLFENGRQVRGVQHCWNIEKDNECQVQGLLSGYTYRVYVVCNYSMTKDSEPCEVQTSSAVLYYTTIGPPKPPMLHVTKVDTYQACLEWKEQEQGAGLKLIGYQIYVDGNPLGGRRSPDVRQMVVNNLVPGKTLSIYVVALSEFGEDESDPSKTIHITCPPRPPAPVISQQPSYKRGCVLIAWAKPEGYGYASHPEAISSYSIYVDNKWHGEVKANQLSDKQGYHFYLTDLSSEQSYDISVKAVAGQRGVDPSALHVYCLSESPMSNLIPVMAPAAPKSPKLRLEGLHPEGIDVTWQVPQQLGDAFISGYQMLKNGKLYGSIIPPDVNSLRIRDVTLGEKLELQLIALTEHPVGKFDRRSEVDKDSGRGSSQPEEKTADLFTGEHYAGCKPGPKLVVHYTGLVCAPTEVWCEKVTGHSVLIVWSKIGDSKVHFMKPDSYQVTWWPGDRPQNEIQSDSTTEDHLLISGLRSSTSYTVVVEARKTEKYTDFDEAFSVNETPDGLNSFILSSKSEQLHVRTASPPDPPSNVGIVAMTCHSIKVGWDPPKEHGSEIIGLRVECISQDQQNFHNITVDTLPDATSAEVLGLHEKTDYLLKVIALTEEFFDQLPEKNALKHKRGFPQNVSSPSEESQWLPCTSVLFKTSGTEAPSNIRVVKSTMTSLTLSWTPPLVYGSNKLSGQIVRWSDVKTAHPNSDEDVHIASHVQVLPTEDSLTIDDLSPGAQYKIVIEAVVSVKTSLDPDKRDSNIEINRRTTHVLSKPLLARTRAPIDPPHLMVNSYTQNSATLTWEKPPLVSVVGKDMEGVPKCLRRYLEGYKLEINGKLQCCMGPDSTSCTLTKCKPGRTYNVVLVAMTCTAEGRKARKQKYQNLQKGFDNVEVDYLTLLQEDHNLDESPSEPVEVTLPKNQEGFLESLEAKFEQSSGNDKNSFGDVELTWHIQGNMKLLKQFNVVWYCLDDRVIQTKYVGPEQRRCTIPVTRLKAIYHMKVEPSYYTDVLPQHSQEVQVMIPGPPDPPQIFLKSVDIDEFCIEWGEPKLYGGVKIKGYQVYLNDTKAGHELTPRQTKATIPCKSNRTYRVNVVALSNSLQYGDSFKSNTLVVNPSGKADMFVDESLSEDAGIPVKIIKITNNSIHLDWSKFLETEEVSFYKIQWSSVAQPDQREVKLSKHDSNCVINKCLPGTTHFVRVVSYNINGQILEKSKQLTIQTSAPPDAPKLSVRACNFRYIAIQWDKPTTYGDALLTGYKVYVNGIVEAVLNSDQLSYTYTQGKWCHEYAFQVQAMTASDNLNSKPSEPLIVTWPGSKPPEVKCLPSISSSTLRVGWSEPYLTDGIKVKHYKLYCVEAGTEKVIQSVGPIHPDSREGEFKNLKKGDYSVYLETHLYGTDTVIKSEIMSMQPALSPDPPQITVTLVGLEERRRIEKFICDLVNKRDRLIRQVGHKLKKIGALSYPLRAEKNEDVVMGAHSLTRIEELLEACFTALNNYTGHLTAIVSWQCSQSNPDMQVSEFKLLVDGKQYGSPIHAGTRTIRIQLGLEQSNYRLSMVATSDKPNGTSAESNVCEVLAMPFKPFSFYCYHAIHLKDVKYPANGCCKFQDSITYERQVAKKLANQGLLTKFVPPPSCSLLDIFDGEYKQLMSVHVASRPTVLLFWTPWCLSSQKIMNDFIRFSRENANLISFIAVSCGVSGATNDGRKSLRHMVTSNSWRDDNTVWHVTSECGPSSLRAQKKLNHISTDSKFEQDKHKDKSMDLAEILGIAGVPTFLFIHPEGYIAWHGRYCAFDYPAFDAFMRHTVSEVLKQPCFVSNCDCCKGDTTVDEVMALQLPNVTSSQTRHIAPRTVSPTSSSDRQSRSDMKYAAINGYTHNVSGTERMFVTEVHKKRSPSPRHSSKRSNISVNQRPYSANSAGQVMLEKSPYMACVAPHIHQPHKITVRPYSAKKFMHNV